MNENPQANADTSERRSRRDFSHVGNTFFTTEQARRKFRS